MSKHRYAYASLADFLERSGVTQEQLAERVGYSQPSISMALKGRGSFTLLKALAKAGNFPLESFDRKDAA
jgi:transcriptional regulator with XRE-family HTH domain